MFDIIIDNMSIVWVVIMVVFLVVEAATAGLTCIWFAIGALAALIAALFGAPIWLQLVWHSKNNKYHEHEQSFRKLAAADRSCPHGRRGYRSHLHCANIH